MRPVVPNDFAFMCDQMPEEAEFVQWLAAIGKPPEDLPVVTGHPRDTHKYWVEVQMVELGIIDKVDVMYFHDWAVAYLDWLALTEEDL